MADDATSVEISSDLAERLRAAASSVGETLDVYVRKALEGVAPDNADWAEIDRICDETVKSGDGVPLDRIILWLRGWGGTRPPE